MLKMPPFLTTTDLFKRADQTARRNCDLIKTAAPPPTTNKPRTNLFK